MCNENLTMEAYLRCIIKPWTDYSVKICEGKCAITGEPYEVVHHKYPFYKILKEVFESINIPRYTYIQEYTKEELKTIRKKCLDLHFKYGAGVCLTEAVHKEFHSYFSNDTCIKDFEEFRYAKINNLDIVKKKSKNKKILYRALDIKKRELNDIELNDIKSKLLHNINILKDENSFKNNYPNLYKYIYRYVDLLIKMNEESLEQLIKFHMVFEDTNLFMVSSRGIREKLCGKSGHPDRINSRLNLFVLLLLLNKPILTKEQEMEVKHFYSLHTDRKTKVCPCTYHIPFYSLELLEDAEKMATLCKNKNLTVKGFSRELIIRTFGENSDFVNKIYPQDKTRKLSDKSNEFSVDFARIIMELINTNGYATESKVVEVLQGYKELNKVKIKRVLQETIEGYGLTRIRVNKQIKETYGITSEGYPFIIVKE